MTGARESDGERRTLERERAGVPNESTSTTDDRTRGSMRWRLTLWVVAIFAVIEWSTSAVFWLYQSTAIVRGFDRRLRDRAEAIVEAIGAEPWRLDAFDVAQLELAQLRLSPLDRCEIELFRPDGARLGEERTEIATELGDLDLVGGPAGAGVAPRFVEIDGEARADDQESALTRAVVLPIATDAGVWTLVVASGERGAAEQLRVVQRSIIVSAIVGPLAAGIAGWFIAGIAVAPFARLRTLARRLGPESIGDPLADTIAPGGENASATDEVARLIGELDRARDRIREAFRSQERFLSNVSHELKTPIAVLLLESETIDRTGFPPAAEAFLADVRAEMGKLGRLVESFLTLTKVRDGDAPSSMRRVACNDLVMDSAEHCATFATQHGVRLAPHLLATEETIDASVRGAEDLLRTMLDNLVRNAVRFSPHDGRVVIELTVEHDRPETSAGANERRFVSIAVIDEGPGIPPELVDHVFDRFAQASVEQRTGRGHGLGLAIAQGIAELHGGVVGAANREEGGCAFTIRLPLDEPDASGTVDAGAPEQVDPRADRAPSALDDSR